MKQCYSGKVLSVTVACIFCFLGVIITGGVGFGQEAGKQEKRAIAEELQQWKVIATSPGVEVLSQHQKSPGAILSKGDDPLDAAYNWLADQGLEEGRNLYRGKLLYASIGSAVINATPEDPAFIDSRYMAFQRADLEAKVKTAIFLGVDLSTERGSSEREINPQERAELETIMNASPTLQEKTRAAGVADTIYNLFQKTSTLIGAKLDKAIKETDAEEAARQKQELAKEKEDTKTRKEKMARLRNISEASLKTAASACAEVQGAQVIQSFEGSYHNNYRVVVITLWTQNLQYLVNSMISGVAPTGLHKGQTKEDILSQLPEDSEKMACLTGVRAYINQTGEYVLVAFGQAGVEVLGGREDKAFELAGQKARLRAMAAVRNFMGEKIIFSSTEDLREVLALYTNEYQGEGGNQEYKSISQFQEKIQSVAKSKKVVGLHGLVTKEITHPFTDKPIVFKAMAWSPSSQALAQELKGAIQHGTEYKAAPKKVDTPSTQDPAVKRKGLISSGKGADKDAW